MWLPARCLRVTHYSYLQPWQTVTYNYYCHQLEKIHFKIAKKHQSLINWQRQIRLHDIVRLQVEKYTKAKLQQLYIDHPLYSLNLSPTWYCNLFRHLELTISDKEIEETDDVMAAFEQFLASSDSDIYIDRIHI